MKGGSTIDARVVLVISYERRTLNVDQNARNAPCCILMTCEYEEVVLTVMVHQLFL
jgi:hypothetical protein